MEREAQVMAVADPATTALLAAVLALVPLALYLLTKRRKEAGESTVRLPPGPRGLPLLGYLPFLKSNIAHCLTDLAHTYGPVMGLRLGSRFCVVLSSPEVVKEALMHQDVIFGTHDAPAVVLHSVYKNEDMAFAPYGPHWRTMRKISVQQLLNAANIERLSSVRQRELGRMVDEVRRRAGESVALQEVVSSAALNAMTMMMWGRRVIDEGEKLGREFLKALMGVALTMSAVNVSDLFPALAWLDLQGLGRQMRRVTSSLDHTLDFIIEQRLRAVEISDGAAAEKKGRDFLQVLVELLRNGDTEVPLTMRHVKALLADMILGGTETTTTIVEWAMAELLHNPHMMAMAKEEISAVVGDTDDTVVQDHHLPMLHYLDAVVREVLRLHPIIPLLIPYRTSSTCTIAGYKIPEGTKVLVNAWALHRDPHLWEQASEFQPERFLKGEGKADYTRRNFQYIPFGAGRRICPGAFLGERTAKFILASLLHRINWRLPDGVRLDLTEKLGIVLKMEKDLIAVPMPQ